MSEDQTGESVVDALTELMEAVEVHKRWWPRVDWSSEMAERRVFAALEKAKKALDSRTCWEGRPGPNCRTSDGRPNWCDVHGARPERHIGGRPS